MTPDAAPSLSAHLLQRLKTKFARPGAQAAARHFGWLAADKLLRAILNVGVGLWVARHLGPARFGLLSYALAVAGLMALFADLGLESVIRRELIAAPQRAASLMASAWRLRLVGGVIAYFVLLASLWVDGAGGSDRGVVAVAGLTVFQPVLCVADLWFQARLAARTSVLAQMAALFLGAGARVVLILTDASLTMFVWVAVGEMVVAGVLLTACARRVGLKRGAFDGAVALRLLRDGWPLLLSGAAVALYLRIDALMLRHYSGAAAVGHYAAAVRFTEIWYFVPMALASSLLPSLLRARVQGNGVYAARMQQFYDLNAGVAYLVMVPIALGAPWLIQKFYGVEYIESARVLAVYIWSTVFIFLGVARSQFLVNEGYTRFYFLSTLAGLLTNVGLNLVLIPRHGAWGAALATLLSQMVAAWASSFCFAPVRATAWMQTRALFIPVRWFHYVGRV